jgi:hypothetical protein
MAPFLKISRRVAAVGRFTLCPHVNQSDNLQEGDRTMAHPCNREYKDALFDILKISRGYLPLLSDIGPAVRS